MNEEILAAIARLEEVAMVHCSIINGDELIADTTLTPIERIDAVATYLKETI